MTRAYHFLRRDMTSGSGNEPAWKVGETRTYRGEIELCLRGYHSSPSWYDALQYAPGPVACIVEVSGNTQTDADKRVSQTRTLIEAKDATIPLTLFVCDCAERVLPTFEESYPDDNRPRNAIETTRLYIKGQATEEDMAAARAAAWDAARATRAARATARAERVAWWAARAVAWDAEWAAEWATERRWQRRKLNQYMKDLFQGDDLDQELQGSRSVRITQEGGPHE